jgi:hypothetical protein
VEADEDRLGRELAAAAPDGHAGDDARLEPGGALGAGEPRVVGRRRALGAAPRAQRRLHLPVARGARLSHHTLQSSRVLYAALVAVISCHGARCIVRGPSAGSTCRPRVSGGGWALN